MNRRDFIKLAGAGLLAAYLPRMDNDMASFSDLLVKIAQNKPLTPGELADLGRFGNETQQRNSFVGGNTTPGGDLNVHLPFFPIYSEVLQVDTASITIPIPEGYKHLMITGSGRNSDTGNSANYMFGRFNGDAGSNYNQQKLQIVGTATVPTSASNQTGALIGMTTNTDVSPSTAAAAFYAIVPHYRSSFVKNVLLFATGGFNLTVLATSIWYDTSPIQSITFLDTVGDILAGSALSIYGIQ